MLATISATLKRLMLVSLIIIMESKSQPLLDQIKSILAGCDQDYLKDHAEIGRILGDYLSALELTRPKDIGKFTMDYFSILRSKKDGLVLKPLMIVGPSGSGKVDIAHQETFHKRLRRQYPLHFEFSVSFTSRAKREGEIEGVNYFYVTREEFEKVETNYPRKLLTKTL